MGAAVKAFLGSAFRAATAVSGAQVALTYRLFVSSKFNPALGKAIETWHEVSIPVAKKSQVNVREIGNATIQVGDVSFEWVASELDAHLKYALTRRVSTSDRIFCEGVDYRVIVFTGGGAKLRAVARVIST